MESLHVFHPASSMPAYGNSQDIDRLHAPGRVAGTTLRLDRHRGTTATIVCQQSCPIAAGPEVLDPQEDGHILHKCRTSCGDTRRPRKVENNNNNIHTTSLSCRVQHLAPNETCSKSCNCRSPTSPGRPTVPSFLCPSTQLQGCIYQYNKSYYQNH